MNDIQFLAERIARLTERIAILEASQVDNASNDARSTLVGDTVIASGYCLVLESVMIPDGIRLDIASGASLVLVG